VTSLDHPRLGRPLTGLETMPASLIISLVTTYAFIWLSGWHRDAHGVMRVRPDRAPSQVIAAVREAAPSAVVRMDEIWVPGSGAARAAALEAIRASGAAITGLTADEGRLEVLYAELLARAAPEAVHE